MKKSRILLVLLVGLSVAVSLWAMDVFARGGAADVAAGEEVARAAEAGEVAHVAVEAAVSPAGHARRPAPGSTAVLP
jgi:hypothetical protein